MPSASCAAGETHTASSIIAATRPAIAAQVMSLRIKTATLRSRFRNLLRLNRQGSLGGGPCVASAVMRRVLHLIPGGRRVLLPAAPLLLPAAAAGSPVACSNL